MVSRRGSEPDAMLKTRKLLKTRKARFAEKRCFADYGVRIEYAHRPVIHFPVCPFRSYPSSPERSLEKPVQNLKRKSPSTAESERTGPKEKPICGKRQSRNSRYHISRRPGRLAPFWRFFFFSITRRLSDVLLPPRACGQTWSIWCLLESYSSPFRSLAITALLVAAET